MPAMKHAGNENEEDDRRDEYERDEHPSPAEQREQVAIDELDDVGRTADWAQRQATQAAEWLRKDAAALPVQYRVGCYQRIAAQVRNAIAVARMNVGVIGNDGPEAECFDDIRAAHARILAIMDELAPLTIGTASECSICRRVHGREVEHACE